MKMEEEKRATEYIVNNYANSIKDAYVAGALEQQKIDISRAIDVFHNYLLKRHNISDDEFNVLKNIVELHIMSGEYGFTNDIEKGIYKPTGIKVED